MKIKQIRFQAKQQQVIKQLVAWEPEFNADVEQTVRTIIGKIRELGDVALLNYTRQFVGKHFCRRT